MSNTQKPCPEHGDFGGTVENCEFCAGTLSRCSHGKKYVGEPCWECELVGVRQSIIYLRQQADRLSRWVEKVEKEVAKQNSKA